MNPQSSLPEEFGQAYGRRRHYRAEETQALAIVRVHRRKQRLVRGMVLAVFGLTMVVYPMMGSLSPRASAIEAIPGVVVGDTPETIEVVFGQAPQLLGTDLPLPSIDETAQAIATSGEPVVSTYLPNCDGSTEWSGTNGRMSNDSMCTIWDRQHLLRSDAAVALAELNHLFKLRFGRNVCLTSTYRTYAAQVRVKRERGYLAATPGTSNHGWGIALDLCRTDYRGEYGDWWRANAPAFGWHNPDWAKKRSLYEPWHWEFGTEDPADTIDPNADPDEYVEPGTDPEAVPDISVDPTPTPSASPDPDPEPTPEPDPEPTPSPTA